MKILATLVLTVLTTTPLSADETDVAAAAINQFGLDLLGQTAKADQNLVLSPYSIQAGLAMTFAGAGGRTREEMSRVLHFPADDAPLQSSFSALNKALHSMAARSAERAKNAGVQGPKNDPLQLHVANRLFGASNAPFRPSFRTTLAHVYEAPLEEIDFVASPAKARTHINQWVEANTQQKIRNLIPPDVLNAQTQLVLTNAIYFKAPWTEKFEASATAPRPFRVAGGEIANVPTMRHRTSYAYSRQEGYVAVAVPYDSGELQFLILLPDDPSGLTELKRKLTRELLAKCAEMQRRELVLELPKLKLDPASMSMSESLKELGLKTAFDDPKRSADFDRMAPRKPDDYLYISDVIHKTFLTLNEEGTEAAAATAVAVRPNSIPQQPIEVKVDRPFLFAIQHRKSGTCLFLGQIVDPR